MKYVLQVNQEMAIKLGIANIQQAIIFDLLSMASTWAKSETIDNKHFYWVARQHISKELPFLNLKLDSIYRHLKYLDKIGLIIYKKLGKKDCILLTEKGKSYYVGNKSEKQESEHATMSEISPNKLGNKSEKDSEINPTYPHTIDYQETILSKESTKEKKPTFPTNLNINAFNDFVDDRSERKKPMTVNAKRMAIGKLCKFTHDEQRIIIENSIIGGYQGLFTDCLNKQNTSKPKQFKTRKVEYKPTWLGEQLGLGKEEKTINPI